jgi:hypothetical protein
MDVVFVDIFPVLKADTELKSTLHCREKFALKLAVNDASVLSITSEVSWPLKKTYSVSRERHALSKRSALNCCSER